MRISSRPLLRALNLAHSLTSHPLFKPLHLGTRYFYISIFTPGFQWFLRQSIKEPLLQLACRHSVLSKSGFNTFSSDIDYSIILPEEVPAHQQALLVSFYHKVSKYLVFIGELELYTFSEWELKQSLENTYADTFNLIRQIRKIVWQELAWKSATSDYHRSKAINSLQRLLVSFESKTQAREKDNLTQIGTSLEKQLYFLFKASLTEFSLQDPLQLTGYSDYLGCWLTNTHQITSSTITLSTRSLILFASLLPDGHKIFPTLQGELEHFRKNLQVQSTYVAILVQELILVHSVIRTTSKADEDVLHWVELLHTILKRYDSPYHIPPLVI